MWKTRSITLTVKPSGIVCRKKDGARAAHPLPSFINRLLITHINSLGGISVAIECLPENAENESLGGHGFPVQPWRTPPGERNATYHHEKAPDEKPRGPIGVRWILNSSGRNGSRDNRSSIRKISIRSTPGYSWSKPMHHNGSIPLQPRARTAFLSLQKRTQ